MYVKPKKARERLGVTNATLRAWADKGYIQAIRVHEGGDRLYNVDEFMSRGSAEKTIEKKNYIYCRVSSSKQKEDLSRQIEYLKKIYPSYTVIKDIGSGINFKRKGLNNLLAKTMQGLVGTVVVAHRDRLCRIAWEHFSWLFQFHGVHLVVEDKQEYSPESELSDDLMSIVHVFSARHYGMRRNYTTRSGAENTFKHIEQERKNETHKTRQENPTTHID